MDKKKMLVSGLVAVLVLGLAGVGVAKYRNSIVPVDTAAPVVTSNEVAPQTPGSPNPPAEAPGTPQSNAAGVQQPKAGGGQPPGADGSQPGPSKGGPVLGMTADELRTKLKAGTTLESIASSKGMTLEQLKEKVIAQEKTKLDDLVAQGKMTSAQAQEMLSRLQSMDLTKLGTEPEMGGGGPSGRPQQPPSGQKPSN